MGSIVSVRDKYLLTCYFKLHLLWFDIQDDKKKVFYKPM